MARTLVAGVDTSTQSCKVRVTDAETGELVRFGQAKHPNGTSVDPSYWWSAFQEAAEQAGGLDDVSALAVGGQQHGMVILDNQGNVIRDAMLWNDTSSAPQAAALIEKRPRQAALGQGRRLLPRRLLHADQGGMGGRELARKRQENRRHLPTSRLAELAHRRLRPGHRRRGRPS